MPAQTPLPTPVPSRPSPDSSVRIEYLNFQNVGEYREFLLRVYGSGVSTEFRFRIAIAAFAAGRVRLQDGPDVCYQMLLRAVAAGETAGADLVTIDDGDLASYREAHARTPKRRSWTPLSPPTPAVLPRRQPRAPSPRLPVAPLVAKGPEPVFQEGQRVNHAVFGAGVTTSSRRAHTVVCFDRDGSKTFVTSLLKLDVLSGPHTWETSPRGKNRPCRAPSRSGARNAK